MSSEISSIARPYSEALFALASESDKLLLWSEMLEFLAVAVADETLASVISNPSVDAAKMTDIMLDIGGGRLNDQAQNLVRLLVRNQRLCIVPEIAAQFEALKNKSEGAIEVSVTSAFEMKPAQEKVIADALKKKFNSQISITSEVDENLIGGIRIKAGDVVIDGSIKGRLNQLASELGI